MSLWVVAITSITGPAAGSSVMLYFVRGSLVLVALMSVLPGMAEAQLFGRHCKHCHGHKCRCKRCDMPMNQCPCGTPTPCATCVPQTTLQPVVETHYAQQPVIQQRDIVETQYRQEPVVETVPATAIECVTVDEGAYQQVWVPKVVTKQVAKTVYQQRTSYRSVPYQVTRRVAECTTQTVPYQTVRYVPTNSSTLAFGSITPGLGMASAPVIGSPIVQNSTTWQSSVAAATPSFGINPTPVASAVHSPVVPPPVPSPGQVPDASISQSALTPISPRTASRDSAMGDYKVAPRNDTPIAPQASSGPSMFVPAPSAAAVWRTPRGTVTR